MKDIKMVDLHGQYLNIKNEVDEAMAKVIADSSFINGADVKLFAEELAAYIDVKHVIPCANGTDALQIALMALDLPQNAEIIVPTFNYVATAEVIALLGYKPVFIDSSIEDFNLLVGKIEEAITENTKAIMPVHLFGQCADMLPILRIAQKYNLFVIEDTAQAIGAEYTFPDGTSKFAGTIGHIGTTSFFPSKNLGCMGDGGAIFTNDDELALKMKTIANHGQKVKYMYDEVGINSRLDTIQAALLRVKLRNLKTYTLNRQNAARYYSEALKGYQNLVTPILNQKSTHVFHQYTLQIDAEWRNDFAQYLKNAGIPTMIYYPKALHLHNAYQFLGYKSGDYVNAEYLSERVISLPMHTELNSEQLSYICESIISYLKSR